MLKIQRNAVIYKENSNMNIAQFIIVKSDILLTSFSVILVVLYIGMFLYLKKNGKIDGVLGGWGGLLWFQVIVIYKKSTKNKKGWAGLCYYIFIICITVVIVIFITQFVFSLIKGPVYLDHEGNIIH